MSILNDLIRIKTSAQEDDLIKMLDEIPVYEKLSVNEQFKDLKSSEIARRKCPMLAAFVDGKIYETILADLVANIYLQIEGNIPGILNTVLQKTPKQQKQFEILQTGIARVRYWDLAEYNHELMMTNMVAVFTKKEGSIVTAAIIVRSSSGYEMYHGSYTVNGNNEPDVDEIKPVIVRGEKGSFIMNTYSVLGNNGYRFGTYSNERISYDVMIGPDGDLFLMAGKQTAANYMIPYEERNALNIAKKDPADFARVILSIIESVV